jgi:co-chaperonin GroES (HSP10)
MIKPLRDNLVAVPIDEVTKVGDIWLPPNKKQALLQHRKMLVLAAGPLAKEQGIESGVVIHASETWGDEIKHKGRSVWLGRSRDIHGIVEGEAIRDTAKYDS